MNQISPFILERVWGMMPWHVLPPSFKIDLCQLLSGIKSCARSQILDKAHFHTLINAIEIIGWHMSYDQDHQDNFFFIAKDVTILKNLIFIDKSISSHEKELGALLGYPECCYNYISKHGENMIDKLDDKFSKQALMGEFALIDISHYREGICLLSHVPCSPQCVRSLKIAKNVKDFIVTHSYIHGFSDWCSKLKEHFKF